MVVRSINVIVVVVGRVLVVIVVSSANCSGRGSSERDCRCVEEKNCAAAMTIALRI